MCKELLKAEQVRLNMHRRFVDLLTEERLQSTKHADETARLRAENDELKHRVETLGLLHSNNLTPEGKQAQDRPEAELALKEIRALRIELPPSAGLLSGLSRLERLLNAGSKSLRWQHRPPRHRRSVRSASTLEAPAFPPATPHAAQGEASASAPPQLAVLPQKGLRLRKPPLRAWMESMIAPPCLPHQRCPKANAAGRFIVLHHQRREHVHDSGQPAVDEVLRLRQQIESNAKQQRRMRLRDRRMFRIRLEVARMPAAAATVDWRPCRHPLPNRGSILIQRARSKGPSPNRRWRHGFMKNCTRFANTRRGQHA